MKTDTELFKEYCSLLSDEREVLERKIKLLKEMHNSVGVFKDFGEDTELLKESLFNIKMVLLFDEIFAEGADSEEIRAFMESDEFKKYGRKKWGD